MKKNIKGIYILELIIFILVIISNILKINYAFNAIMLLATVFCYLRFGFVKDNAYEKSNIVRIIIAVLMASLIAFYGLGLFTGFYNNIVNYRFLAYYVQLALIALLLLSEEVIRYIVAKNCIKSIKPLVFLTIVFIILNIVTQINMTDLNNRWSIFVFVSTFAVPITAREMLCSFITYKCSYIPVLVYRLMMEVALHLLPIVPNVGEYLYAVFKIIIPAIVFFFANKIFKYHEKSGTFTKKASRRIILLPIILLSLVMIYLVSGLFKYKMIAIASGSMKPVYYRGDAVIYEKKDASQVKEGDILVFTQGHRIVTHRIVSITKSVNNKYDIITKGDNNNTNDLYVVQKDDVKGVVKYSIKYVGYPTLWINSLID